jgi:small subunit ribosomal protein S17
MDAPKKDRNARRSLVGTVSGTKMSKTISVRVQRMVQHPLFKKYLKRSSVYKAHDENGEAGVGDRVEIAETRRISKTKCFRLVRIIAKARIPASTPEVVDLPEAEG